ncbi:hypothetical protein QF049_005742 [Paenibacillus sp. W4I10]|uniref:hypothetical protein n=1 Tax=Paenibacillus sp. W4I10 TaxID=3042298 RepID=UPI002780BC08|nr:hypothetical protein [Paenibacillus sp. W4I10]MDQ0724481.1 hypothetical protein [Paenibacillus sp. W4I10]
MGELKLRILALIFFISTVFFISNAQHANALSCAESASPQEELERNTGAVYGEVKQIKVDLKQKGFTGTKEKIRYILVEAERSWNTEVDSQLIIGTNYTWGFDFKEGNKYLIYFSEVDGELSSSPCSLTIEMNNLNQATELFGEGYPPKKQVNVEHKMWFMFEQDIDLYIVGIFVLAAIFILFMIVKKKKRKV